MAGLKVLMIASSVGTGLMSNLTNLSLALKRRGLDVAVISTDKEQGPGMKKMLIDSGIKVYTCKHIDGRSPWSIYQGTREIGRILRSEEIDVIHAHGVGHVIKARLALIFCRRQTGIVQSLHAYAHGWGYKGALFLKVAPKIMNLCADSVAPVSERIGQNLVRAGLSPGKNMPVHNGIDLAQFDANVSRGVSEYLKPLVEEISGKPAIIYPAVLVTRKGHCYLLKAATQVVKEYPESKFIITSDGPLRSELEKMASDLGIAGNTIFTGRMGYEDLHYLLSRVTIGVFPSLAELLPMAILDMMAARKPVVATDVAGIPEMVVDGQTGFLVPPMDSGALAERILQLLRDPRKSQQMGAMGRKIVEEKFASGIIAARTEEVYKLVVSKKSGKTTQDN